MRRLPAHVPIGADHAFRPYPVPGRRDGVSSIRRRPAPARHETGPPHDEPRPTRHGTLPTYRGTGPAPYRTAHPEAHVW